jgi:hypothetical protein
MPEAKEIKELLALIAPGLIILGIRQWFVAAPTPKLEERALNYAAVSAVYFVVATPTVAAVARWLNLNDFTAHAWEYLYLPSAIGLLFGVGTYFDWPAKIWTLLRVQPVHHIGTAWDYAFRSLPRQTYIVVTLNDGTQVAGLYDGRSFTSSMREERDILVDTMMELDEAGVWSEATPSKRILLCGRDIRAVEFFKGVPHERRQDRIETAAAEGQP